MHSSVLKSLAVVVVVAVCLVPRVEAVLEDLLDGVAVKLLAQGSLSGLDFLDHECELSKDFVLDGLNLYFTAEMTCSGWTEIVGEALGPDLGVLAMAIKDFVIKAVVQGLITEVELQAWLEIELVG